MSRRTHKTINLPNEVIDRIDNMLASGRLCALSRDDFVRQAIGIVFLAMDEKLPKIQARVITVKSEDGK